MNTRRALFRVVLLFNAEGFSVQPLLKCCKTIWLAGGPRDTGHVPWMETQETERQQLKTYGRDLWIERHCRGHWKAHSITGLPPCCAVILVGKYGFGYYAMVVNFINSLLSNHIIMSCETYGSYFHSCWGQPLGWHLGHWPCARDTRWNTDSEDSEKHGTFLWCTDASFLECGPAGLCWTHGDIRLKTTFYIYATIFLSKSLVNT